MSKANLYYVQGIVSAEHLSHEQWLALDVPRYIMSNAIKLHKDVLTHYHRYLRHLINRCGVSRKDVVLNFDDSVYDEVASLFIAIGTPVLSSAIRRHPDHEGSARDRLLRGSLRAIVLKRVRSEFIDFHVPKGVLPDVRSRASMEKAAGDAATGGYMTVAHNHCDYDEGSSFDSQAAVTYQPVIACLANSEDIIADAEADHAADTQRTAYLLEMLRHRLTPMEYRVLRAHLVDGLSKVDIATAFGCHPNGVYNRLASARERLASILAEQQQDRSLQCVSG